MSANHYVIVIFPIFGQFGVIRNPDSGCIICKTYIFINSNFFILQKLKVKLKKFLHSSHTIALSKNTIAGKK